VPPEPPALPTPGLDPPVASQTSNPLQFPLAAADFWLRLLSAADEAGRRYQRRDENSA